MQTPPATWTAVIFSERSTSANTAAMNGWRLAASVARDGPILCSERNQSTFVRTSGPSVAKTRRSQMRQPRP